MRHHRAVDYRRSPWKNGKGETLEVAVHPPLATMDTFEWRISVALLETDADFSEFAGIERSLAIIKGAGIALTVGDEVHRLDRAAPPLRFAGDTLARADLLGGRSADLNVMTRSASASHEVVRVAPGSSIRGGAGFVAIFAQTALVVSMREAPFQLAEWDLLSLNPDEAASIVRGEGLVVRVQLHSGPSSS